jgi:hypothetical protein
MGLRMCPQTYFVLAEVIRNEKKEMRFLILKARFTGGAKTKI